MRKQAIMSKLIKFLKLNTLEYFIYHGCFDVLVKANQKIYAIKILGNIDSLLHDHAENLKILASATDTIPILLGIRTNKTNLKDDILYQRFSIFASNFRTLKKILLYSEMPSIIQSKKGLYVFIDSDKLRNERSENNLTQKALADRLGISKKNIYEHEKTDKLMLKSTYMLLRNVITKDVSKSINLRISTQYELPIKTKFEYTVCKFFTNIGFSIAIVRKTPFNVVATKTYNIMSYVSQHANKSDSQIKYLKDISLFFGQFALLITKDKSYLDIPSLTLDELKEKDEHSIIKLIKTW